MALVWFIVWMTFWESIGDKDDTNEAQWGIKSCPFTGR